MKTLGSVFQYAAVGATGFDVVRLCMGLNPVAGGALLVASAATLLAGCALQHAGEGMSSPSPAA